jgi:glucosamine kinase
MGDGPLVHGPLVLGADVGATSSRAVLADLAGRRVGAGSGPGGNVNSSTGDPAANIAAALRAALDDHDPTRVVAGMVGLAGAAADPPATQRLVDTAWRAAGLPGSPRTGTDLDIAYAAGATGPDGILLLAGTGAVGAAFRGYAMAGRCDGLGWLLGDEGSAVWLGLTAVRAAVAALDGRAAPTALTGLLATEFAGDPRPADAGPTGDAGKAADAGRAAGSARSGRQADPRQELVVATYRGPLAPARFGALAPLVTRAAAEGDAVAGGIVADGCAALLRTAEVVAGMVRPGCVVVAGSLLTTPGPVADTVTAGLVDRFGAAPVPAPAPVVGAVLTALRDAGVADPAALRDKITA